MAKDSSGFPPGGERRGRCSRRNSRLGGRAMRVNLFCARRPQCPSRQPQLPEQSRTQPRRRLVRQPSVCPESSGRGSRASTDLPAVVLMVVFLCRCLLI